MTWERGRPITIPGQNDQTIGNQIAVQPNGTLVDIFAEFHNENARKLRGWTRARPALDGQGRHLVAVRILVDRLGTIGVTDPETGDAVRTGDIIPEVAVDRRPARSTPSGRTPASAAAQADAIAFSQSLDGGLTWSTPIKVNLTPTASRPATSRRSHHRSRSPTTARSGSRTTTSATTRGRADAADGLLRRPLPPDRRRPRARAPATGATRSG